MRKVQVKPKEEPKVAEVKKTKAKIAKPKKYEELPEIPDYERPELEVYEESDFDPNKNVKQVATPVAQVQNASSATPVQLEVPTKKEAIKVSSRTIFEKL